MSEQSKDGETPEQLRAEAIECGRRANRHLAFGENNKARYQIEKARKLTLRALELEQSTPPAKGD
jgi:hypothetical protein